MSRVLSSRNSEAMSSKRVNKGVLPPRTPGVTARTLSAKARYPLYNREYGELTL